MLAKTSNLGKLSFISEAEMHKMRDMTVQTRMISRKLFDFKLLVAKTTKLSLDVTKNSTHNQLGGIDSFKFGCALLDVVQHVSPYSVHL